MTTTTVKIGSSALSARLGMSSGGSTSFEPYSAIGRASLASTSPFSLARRSAARMGPKSKREAAMVKPSTRAKIG